MAGYALDGTPQVDYATLSFIAPAWCLLQVRRCDPNQSVPAFAVRQRAQRASAHTAHARPHPARVHTEPARE
jgi:hypothetical protein